MFTKGQGEQSSIPGQVLPMTQKTVLDVALLNIQQYKVRIKGKVEISREKNGALPYALCSSSWKRDPSRPPWLRSLNLLRVVGLMSRVFANSPGDQGFNPRLSHTHHHHHHVMPLARISLTLSRLFSLSLIASGRSSGLHPVSSQSCWMYVCAGRPAFARPYVGAHRSTSVMSSSLLF